MKTKQIARTFGILIIAALAFIGAIALPHFVIGVTDEIWLHDDQRPTYVTSFGDFREWKPTCTNVYEVEINGGKYFVIIGEVARSFASAPAGYLFDLNGNYLAWSPDVWDEPFSLRFYPQLVGKGIGTPVAIDSIPMGSDYIAPGQHKASGQ